MPAVNPHPDTVGLPRLRSSVVGLFGTYLYESGCWSERADAREATEPWLFLNIYDSDIATIMYRPCEPGTGIAFLGHTPRKYFDDPNASLPTDTVLESAGLARWWAQRTGAGDELARDAKQTEIASYLASDADWDLAWPRDDEDADAPVEVKVCDFLQALGLDVPDDVRAPLTAGRPGGTDQPAGDGPK